MVSSTQPLDTYPQIPETYQDINPSEEIESIFADPIEDEVQTLNVPIIIEDSSLIELPLSTTNTLINHTPKLDEDN